MGHGFTDSRVDAGLPALPRGFECFKHIGIHAHVQGWAFDCNCGPSTPTRDAGSLPKGIHGGSIVRAISAIGSGVCNGQFLRGLTLNPLPIGCGGLTECFGRTVSFPV